MLRPYLFFRPSDRPTFRASERVPQRQLHLVIAGQGGAAGERFRIQRRRVVQPRVEREGRNRLRQRARVAARLNQRRLVVEDGAERGQLDLTPMRVEQVEEVEDVELQRQRLAPDRRNGLADRQVEAVLEWRTAAVALHDPSPLTVETWLRLDEVLESLRGRRVLHESAAGAGADLNLRAIGGVPRHVNRVVP